MDTNIWPKTMPRGKYFHSVNLFNCSSGHHHFEFEVWERKVGMQPEKGQISCSKLKNLRFHSLDPFGPRISNWQSQSTWAGWGRTENTDFRWDGRQQQHRFPAMWQPGSLSIKQGSIFQFLPLSTPWSPPALLCPGIWLAVVATRLHCWCQPHSPQLPLKAGAKKSG